MVKKESRKLATSSMSVVNSGLTDDYRLAIAEYIWNGYDAAARVVDIQYQKADDFGNIANFVHRRCWKITLLWN